MVGGGSAHRLYELDRINFPMTSQIRGGRVWHTYHPMLRAYFLAEANRLGAELCSDLRLRAARQLMSAGELRAALPHLLTVADHRQLAGFRPSTRWPWCSPATARRCSIRWRRRRRMNGRPVSALTTGHRRAATRRQRFGAGLPGPCPGTRRRRSLSLAGPTGSRRSPRLWTRNWRWPRAVPRKPGRSRTGCRPQTVRISTAISR